MAHRQLDLLSKSRGPQASRSRDLWRFDPGPKICKGKGISGRIRFKVTLRTSEIQTHPERYRRYSSSAQFKSNLNVPILRIDFVTAMFHQIPLVSQPSRTLESLLSSISHPLSETPRRDSNTLASSSGREKGTLRSNDTSRGHVHPGSRTGRVEEEIGKSGDDTGSGPTSFPTSRVWMRPETGEGRRRPDLTVGVVPPYRDRTTIRVGQSSPRTWSLKTEALSIAAPRTHYTDRRPLNPSESD